MVHNFSIKLLFLLIAFLCAINANAACGGSSPNLTAADASQAEVAACITAAVDGDTITIPNGSSTWGSGVTISGKGIKVCGQTEGSVNITHGAGTSTLFAVVRDASHHTEICNIDFLRGAGSGRYLDISGDGAKIPLVHDNFFAMDDVGGDQPVRMTANGGVFWNNSFIASTYHYNGCVQLNPDTLGDAIWDAAHTIGTADTDGTANTYFEDNIYEGCLQQSIDGSNGAKVVFRYNTLTDAATVVHGADTDQYGGCRHFEFYNNTFIRVTNSFAINRWFYVRGCTGVITDNVIPEASSPDGSSYPNKTEIDLTIQYLRRNAGDYACWNTGDGGHPAPHQVGQVTHARDATPDFPLAIYNNTGAGTSSGNYITPTDYDPDECMGGEATADYIQAARDYITSAPGAYTKYEYPHPLRTDGEEDPPAPTSASRMRLR